ncbi:MAG TPA: winged helix-turn-helix domain-containing protein [Rhodanobacteraceae bacterium]|nr:winged helix-turn-helix domain-containing protein [Rhodanobacteraceae bacterium]
MARDTFAFADVVIDAGAHRLLRGDQEMAVEPKAFAVLLEFLSHPGQMLSRDQLLDAVWGHSYVTPATLNRIVAQLRRALADDSEAPHCIQTVHGLGYRFIAPLERVPEKTAAALRFAPPARARIPERTEPLLGRERDIESLKLMLRDHRLVTIIGPGGLGKTQAALETARSIEGEFPDGVWMFDCTPQTDGEALVRWLAGMFDIRASAETNELLARSCELLQTRQVLLVFDNCERIAEPLGKAVTRLLSGCAGLHVLVTSQQRLNCAGESLYGLPPLQVPAPGEWTTDEQIASLSSIPAVRLLLLRSQACASGFTLTPANATTVAEICRRVAGLPLALELAAARLRLLSPEQLLIRMEDRLLSLSDDNPNRPARHQTLSALIEWSFALLSEHEQALLCGLSVFAGTCTLGGASAVGAVFRLDEEETLDLLGGLVDKSLLTVDAATNPPSYRLLDSVRLFAQGRLAANGDEVRVRTAHLAHFVQLTELIYTEIRGNRFQLWFERVRREWNNLHAAFDFALVQPDCGDSALALIGNLCWYFRGSTDYSESMQWAERALQARRASCSRHLARALVAAGVALHMSKVHERAKSRLREGIALAKNQGDTALAAAGEAVLSFELATCGDFAGARACAEAVLAIAGQLDDGWLRSNALLGRGIAESLDNNHCAAEASISEALKCLPLQGNSFDWAYTLINRALQRFYVGDWCGAAQDWLTDLEWFARFQNWRGLAGCVEGAAYLAAEHGEPAKTARFLAATARVREWTGGPLFEQWREGQHVAGRKAREALGPEFERAQEAGASARFEDVVMEGRALLMALDAQTARTGANNFSGS